MLVLVNISEEDGINNSKYKNGRKSRNKINKILVKFKNRNLSKSRSRKLFTSKKIQNTSTIKKPNFLTLNTKVVFTKLR